MDVERTFDFVGKFKMTIIISGLVLIIGLGFMLTQGFNLGIDFTGGGLLELKFEENVTSEQVRDVLGSYNLEKSPVQSAGENAFIIRTGIITEKQSTDLLSSMEQELGAMDILRNEKVDAVIGGELTRNGILAVLIAGAAIVLYITWRFEFNFAIAGIIALFHDILVVVAFMAIFQLEVDSTFIAALLTTLGYSINDTIVVFDRIRENIKDRKYKGDLKSLANDSIMQTLRRTIFTTGSTMIALIALVILGGETTKVFSIAMLVGCVSGVYSTIFIATPVWILMREKRYSNGSKKGLRAQKV